MKNTATNSQAISLINRAFNSQGLLINPKSRKNQKEAIELLENNDFYGQLLDGYDVHTSLTIIAYPNREI